jgi:hypothetical protein
MRSVPVLALAALLAASSSHPRSAGAAPGRQLPPSAPGAAATASQAKPDFSGTWILDIERSSIGAPERQRLPAETLVVKQTDAELTFNLDLGDGAAKRTVPTDGEKHEWTGRDGASYEVEAKWMVGRLVMTAAASRPSFLRITRLSWSLSADGKELTVVGTSVDRSWERPNETVSSEVTTSRVYRRQ